MRCPARLVGSRAQFDSATRFSSPGDLPSSAAFSRLRWQLGMLLSCARRLLSSWQGCNRAGPSSRDEAGVLQPLFHRTQERRWSSTNPGLRLLNRALHRLPFKMLTHRRMIKCIQPRDWFAAINLKDAYFHVSILPRHRPFYGLRPRVGHGSTGSSPSGSPCPPVSSRRSWRVHLAPLREVGIRILNCLEHGPHARTVMRSQGPGASAPQPVGASGQLGKVQALPCAENLFSQCGVRLGEYDGPPHGRARPVSAELPEFLRRQDCGPTETVSEAPGAYGIRSRGHTAQIASYETTSALVTLPNPEVGMAPRCTSGEHHTGVSPLLQPLDRPCLSTGRGALRTSVSACCRHNRCLQHGLGRYMQQAGSLGALTGPRLLWHINCLELLAVHLALRQFRPLLLGKHVLVRTDNTAAVSYINRGGVYDHAACHSSPAISSSGVTRGSNRCALSTFRGCSIVRADALSRQLTFPGEWRLHPETIRLIWSRFGEAQVDLFASRESSHCQWFSP